MQTAVTRAQFGFRENEQLPAPKAGGLYKTNCRHSGRSCRGLFVPRSSGRRGQVSVLSCHSALRQRVLNSVGGGDCRSPLVTKRSLKLPEQDTVYRVSDSGDKDHDDYNLIDVIQIPARHKELPKAKGDVKHFTLNQGTPRECPTLLQSVHQIRQTRREQDMPE